MKKEFKRLIILYFTPAVLAAVLFAVLVFGYIIPNTKAQMMDMKKENIRFLAQSLWGILQNYQNRVEAGDLTLEQAQERALDHIRSIRYGIDGKDYFWIHGTDLIMKMHPYVSELEGKDLSNYSDKEGNLLFVAMCNRVHNDGEAYIKYYWQFKDMPQQKQKESFVKLFEPWGWVIGTGIYFDDIEQYMHPVIKSVINYSFLIFTLILILIAWLAIRSFKAEMERSRIEKENFKSALKYRSTFETTGTAMFIVAKDSLILQLNRKFTVFLGYEEAQAEGKSFIDFIHPDYREKVEQIQRNFLSNPDSRPVKMKLRMIKSDSGVLDVIFTIGSMTEDKCICSFIDISELVETHKRLELEMQKRLKTEEQLQHAQKMDTIGTLAGGLAHNFNNVLGGITGTVSLIKHLHKSDEGISDSELIEYINVIDESSMRAAEIVRQLLNISRKSELKIENLNICEVINQVVKICHNTFDKSVEINLQCDEKIQINADRLQLEQVILNVCINAYHAMTIMNASEEKTGGELTISTNSVIADSEFCQKYHQANNGLKYCHISISDTGIGISKSNLNKIFDPFFTTKIKDKGTGLGLSMVYNIVQQHQGFIEVQSQTGKGSVFNVFLPIQSEKNVLEKQVPEAGIIKGSGVVLVVDDEDIVRFTAAKMLEECGYTVLQARDGIEAVEIFEDQHEKISAILLDIIMPRMSGVEVYDRMLHSGNSKPVIFISGFSRDEKVEELVKTGKNFFVEKPFTLSTLSKTINLALS